MKFLNIGRCPVQPDQLDKQGWNEQDTEEEDQWRRKRWQVNHILLNECLNFFIINDIVGKNNPAAPEHEGDTTYQIKVRLRVRLADGKLYFVYQLVRADIPERNAIKDIADKLAKDLPENRIHRGAVCLCTKSSFTGEIDR